GGRAVAGASTAGDAGDGSLGGMPVAPLPITFALCCEPLRDGPARAVGGIAVFLGKGLTMTAWRGVFPAVTTKLRQDGSIDLKATQASLDRLIVNGVSGGIVLPMLGENASLTAAERGQGTRAATEGVAGRRPRHSRSPH